MRLTSTGLGIGTTSPTGALDIKSATQPQLKIATASATADRNAGFLVTLSNSATPGSRSAKLSLDSDGGDGSGTDNLTITKTGNSGDATITNESNANIVFGTNNAEKVRITSDGSVGIGTTSPDGILHLDGGTNTKLVLEKDGSGYASLTFHNDGTQTSYIQLDGSENMVHYGGSGVDQIFYSGGSERMRIVNNTVMVGKTSAGGSTNGVELKTNDESRFTQTSRTVVAINRLTDDGNIVEFKKDNTTVGSIGAFGGNIVIGTNDTGLRFNPGSSSDYITPFNISSYANSSNAISLGHPAITFKDIYLGGGAFIGGTGSSNKLDDYEEGTWTPAIATAGGTLSVTYAERTGKYTKIGNVVYYEF